jgi:hypothetical protein
MNIWTVRADGSERKLLIRNPGTDTWPVISHDRKTVLYVHIERAPRPASCFGGWEGRPGLCQCRLYL